MSYTTLSEERIGNWLQTFSGIAFYPLDPRPEDIDINDIAHALSNICRYGGHCDKYYSVAQHSILVSNLVPGGMELWGLLHDASEAYLVDIPRPVKEYLSDYRAIEDKCMGVIAARFDLQLPIPEEVKLVDNAVLKLEREQLMSKTSNCVWFVDNLEVSIPWYKNGNFMEIELQPQSPNQASNMFLLRYDQILKI